MMKRTSNIQELCTMGVVTSVICIMAQISIPTPLGVPLTMQTFAIALAGIILGAKKGAIATLIYILIGGIGVPVFSNLTGGYQYLIGPRGGFLLSFPMMAFVIGLGSFYLSKWKWSLTLAILLGATLNLTCGVLLFCYTTHSNFIIGITTCALPFIPGEILKMLLAYLLGINIKKRLH